MTSPFLFSAEGLIARKPLLGGLVAAFMTEGQYDFWSRELGSTAAWRRVFARVVAAQWEAADTLTLTLRPNRNLGPVSAGQHLTLSADIAGRRHCRSYSLSRLASGRDICLTVRREPGGLVSNFLHDHVQVGDVLELSQPYGDLATGLLSDAARPLVMLAAGSGITAIYNLLASMATSGRSLQGELLYWEKQPDRFCFTEELNRLQAEHAGFRVSRFCNAAEEREDAERGRLDAALAARLAGAYPAASIVACGGGAFVTAARELLGGVGKEFRAEAFTPSFATIDDEAEEQFYGLVLRRSGKTLRVSNRQSLLEQIEDAGLSPEHGCRMGICNSCSCQQRGGESVNELNGAALRGQGAVRLCVSRANSDLELDL
ncbi:iron-sulfur cluster-binding domain-containing protein [Spongiibacter sp.]|uniref:flavin reductase family protein n=1 Tax=Spongiibacter sp. TaxID=2024860 RepID=UPI000C4C132B|nr:iron-sulfur cluster-binding domain-containing protein [Spongiibacter sp.]MBU72218.1 hypothetical protein [Spongiibacter sp.]